MSSRGRKGQRNCTSACVLKNYYHKTQLLLGCLCVVSFVFFLHFWFPKVFSPFSQQQSLKVSRSHCLVFLYLPSRASEVERRNTLRSTWLQWINSNTESVSHSSLCFSTFPINFSLERLLFFTAQLITPLLYYQHLLSVP